MNTKKLKTIPKFRSALEEAVFWDTVDTSEYFDFSKPSKIRFEFVGEAKEETMTFRLHKSLKTKLNEIAHSLGISASSLLRMWTIEKLSTS